MPIAAMRWLPIHNGRFVQLFVGRASCVACGAASSLRAIPGCARVASPSRDVHRASPRDDTIHAIARALRHPPQRHSHQRTPCVPLMGSHSWASYSDDSSGTGTFVSLTWSTWLLVLAVPCANIADDFTGQLPAADTPHTRTYREQDT